MTGRNLGSSPGQNAPIVLHHLPWELPSISDLPSGMIGYFPPPPRITSSMIEFKLEQSWSHVNTRVRFFAFFIMALL